MKEQSVLVQGRAVVVGISADGQAEIISDGAVALEAGVITSVGPLAELRSMYPDCPVLGSPDSIVAPGFVNGHHHVGLTPFQLGAPDLPLELWLGARTGLRPVDPYLDTLYSGFEMIETGVTTVQHLHVSRAPAEAIEFQAGEILRAYRDLGMRISYSFGYRDQNRLVYGSDEAFLASLPQDLAEVMGQWFAAQRIPMEEQFALFRRLRERTDGDELAAVQLAPSNLHWCSDEALVAIGELSRLHDVPIHMHLLETKFQKRYARQRTGGSAVAHLETLGLLTSRLTLGHAVWVSEDDLDLIASSGACICHNASSNLRLRSGIAPCNHFRKHGIPVAIGMDEAGINDDRDILQEMRLVLNIHRVPGMESGDVPSAGDVFRMATEHGARTTPFAHKIGRLQAGMAADLVLFDWHAIADPYLDAGVPLLDALVYRAKQRAVRAVMIGGRVVYQDGKFVAVDREAATSALREAMQRPQTPEEAKRAEVARELAPFVRQFYGQDHDMPVPFSGYVINDRN